MNGILYNNNSENKLHGVLCPKSPDSVETAGSLAMAGSFSLFDSNTYDEFSCSNPFAVDYSLYSDCDDCTYNGFLSSFSNAMSTISSFGGEASFSGCDCSGGCSSGSFTSVC